MRKLIERIAIVLLLGAFAGRTPATPLTLYVSPDGDDRWPGTQAMANPQRTDGPLRSLSAAVEHSRQARRQGEDEIRILLRGGTYTLDDPLVLTAEDSGLVIAAQRYESPIISGQTVIRGWRCSRTNPNIWETKIEDVRNGNWIFHELFVNGERKERTRIPEQGFFRMVGLDVSNYPSELQFHRGDVKAEWARPGDVELITYQGWTSARNQIREVIAASNIVSLAGKAIAHRVEKNGRFYIENAPVALRPGQWHLDLHSGVLTYWPNAGEDVPNATITAPHLYDLVHINGDDDAPAHDIIFRGITFADTEWRLDGGSDIEGQSAIGAPSAVQARFARDCTFERCTFERLGGYALELDRGCERDKIIGNEMHDLGAGGIRVGAGKLDEAVPYPCGHNEITDNHIHDIGLVSAPATGICVLLSGQNRIAHNEIDHTYYTAISVGWYWGYAETPCQDNIVEFNHLHDIGQGILSDMGGIYTLGVQPGTILRNNLIHDVNDFAYGGWGLYTDEGSSHIVLENNIVYRCQSAGFHQHYGESNVLCNNIFAFNKEAQLARTKYQPPQSFIFTNNIVYFDTGRLFGGKWWDDLEMDRNFFYDTRAAAGDNQTLDTLHAWQARGNDVHSLFVDPLFIAPSRDDFRLRGNSPALRFGFQQIDMSDVGVRSKFRRP